MTEHDLKSIPPYFQAIVSGEKTFDVRVNDRGYQRGDMVLLNEWHPEPTTFLQGCDRCGFHGSAQGHYAQDEAAIRRQISYVFSGDPRFGGIEPGYVVLGLQPLPLILPDPDK